MKTKTNDYTILVFRHGESRYWQGNNPVTIEEASDLAVPLAQGETERSEDAKTRTVRTKEAIEKVMQNAVLARDYFEMTEFCLHSSPTGRALHSAKVIAHTFSSLGFSLRGAILSLTELTEVRHFNWKLFAPLCVGGEVEINGEKFVIDVADSNPRNLSFGAFFYHDFMHGLPRNIKKKWPTAYVKAIEKLERAIDVRRRMRTVLRSLTRQPMRQVIVVTHDALCGFLVRTFTHGKETELAKGEFVVLKGNAEKLVVTAVGQNTTGDSKTTIFDFA